MYKDMYIYIYNPYEEEKMSYIYGVIFFMITFEVIFFPSHIDYIFTIMTTFIFIESPFAFNMRFIKS